MDRDTAVSQIISDLKHSGIESTVITDLQLAQAELELEFHPWWLLKNDATLQNLAGTLDTITLPSDWLVESEEHRGLWRLDASGNRTDFIDKDDWQAIARSQLGLNVANRNGNPTHYAIVGSEIRLGPLFPEAQETFEIWYYAADTVLSTNVENGWLANAPEVLKSKTGLRTALGLRDTDAVAFFLARLEGDPTRRVKGAMQILREMDEQRKLAGSSPRMRYSGER